jgi:hypothetical protein
MDAGNEAFELCSLASVHKSVPKIKSAEPRHCSRNADQGAQQNSARSAPFRMRPSTASVGYKSVAAQVRRFP